MKKVCLTFFIFIAFILVLYARTLYEARHYLDSAKEALANKSKLHAIDFARKSVSWSAPFNAYSKEAVALLTELSASKDLDAKLSLEALLALKRGLMSSRSFLAWSNREAELDLIDEQIKLHPLMKNSTEPLYESHPPQVNFAQQLFTQCMFWAWILAALCLICFGFTKEGKAVLPQLIYATIGVCLFYCLWLFSL